MCASCFFGISRPSTLTHLTIALFAGWPAVQVMPDVARQLPLGAEAAQLTVDVHVVGVVVRMRPDRRVAVGPEGRGGRVRAMASRRGALGIGTCPTLVGSDGTVMITTVEPPLLSLIETPLRMIGGSGLPLRVHRDAGLVLEIQLVVERAGVGGLELLERARAVAEQDVEAVDVVEVRVGRRDVGQEAGRRGQDVEDEAGRVGQSEPRWSS